MDKQCGNNLPAPVTYMGPGHVTIMFHTDPSVSDVGWKLAYSTPQEGNYWYQCCLFSDVILRIYRRLHCTHLVLISAFTLAYFLRISFAGCKWIWLIFLQERLLSLHVLKQGTAVSMSVWRQCDQTGPLLHMWRFQIRKYCHWTNSTILDYWLYFSIQFNWWPRCDDDH